MVVKPIVGNWVIRGNRTQPNHINICFRPIVPIPRHSFPDLWESEPYHNLWKTWCFIGNWSLPRTMESMETESEESLGFVFSFGCEYLWIIHFPLGHSARLQLGWLRSCWAQTLVHINFDITNLWKSDTILLWHLNSDFASSLVGLGSCLWIGSWFNFWLPFNFFFLTLYVYP